MINNEAAIVYLYVAQTSIQIELRGNLYGRFLIRDEDYTTEN